MKRPNSIPINTCNPSEADGGHRSQSTSSPLPSALKNFDSLPDSAHVRQPIVQALFCCSAATVWRMAKRGTIPAPRKLSENISAWNVGELREALKAQVHGSTQQSGGVE